MRKKSSKVKLNRKRTLRSIVSVLAAIVVFVTTYALIIPAITMEKMLICEIPEHEHDGNCYSDGKLICGKTEHVHTDACYDAPKAVEPIYICGHTEHIHTEECYFSDGTLKCTRQEHTHTDACLFVNSVRLTSNLLLAGGGTPVSFYGADPDTSDLLALFKINGSYNVQNDGKVAVDKSVYGVDTEDQFRVVLSAVGQSYVKTLSVSEMVHPDVVFVVDISTSMARQQAGSSGVSRLAAVADALNNAIDKLLEQDPQTRIGIVSYSNYVWDGTRDSNGNVLTNVNESYKHLYLPLANYERMGENFEYVQINRTDYGQNAVSNAEIYFNTDWHQITFNENGNKTAADGTNYTVGSAVKAYRTKTIQGTFTQDGLLGGVTMFNSISQEEKALREPVMVLITDGEPTRFCESESNTKANRKDDGSATNTTHCGYWTVRTAMYAKSTIQAMYDTAYEVAGIENKNKMMFDTIGPGVTSVYGKTILNPTSDNLDAAKNWGNSSNSAEKAAYNLYYDIKENPTLKLSDVSYADFADYSLTGNLAPEDIKEGMNQIIANLRNIPRPIYTTSSLVENHFNIIDTNSLMTFIDTLGEGMELKAAPTIHYGSTSFESTVKGTGTLGSDDRYTSEYAGQPYTLYGFSGTVKESSTGKILDMSKVILYEIIAKDGSTVLIWQFPDELLPVIYHNPGADPTSDGDDSFVETSPLRLEFNVQPFDGFVVPGETYYSNSTKYPTTANYQISEDNPYYNTKTEENDETVYTPKNMDSETEKTDNKTDTRENSWEYDQTGLSMNVILGNNGKLFTPLYLDVCKVWQASDTHPDSVSVTLYANGNPIDGRTVTLNADNDWKYRFEDLSVYDASGNKIVYTVREEVPDGYTVTGENDEPHKFDYTYDASVTVPAKWEAADSFSNDNIYRLRIENTNSDGLVVKDDGNGNLISGTVSNSTTDTTEQWRITDDRIQNVASGKYLGIKWNTWSLDYDINDHSTTVRFSQDNPTRKILLKRSGHESLRLTHENGSFSLTSSNSTSYYLERLIPEIVNPRTETYTLYGFKLINKPTELNISAEKIWGFGTAGMECEVTLQVYQKDSYGVVAPIDGGTITLNSEGSWKDTYVLSPVTSGSTYYVAEVGAGNFNVSYSGGQIENLTYGGNTFPAVKVDVQHEAKIEVTNNTNSIELPSTGSFGPDYLYGFGALLTAGALIIGLILWRRREGGSEM